MTILEIESLFKTFGPVKALNDVSLSVEEGETMAIVGQNGAGKSTLVKILTGAYQKSSGQIRLEGKDVTISSPQVAKRLGIAEVYQQAELILEFTVAENVVIGYPEYSSKGFVNRRRLEKAVQEMLDRYQIPLRAEQKVGELSAALRQLVAIMKVLFGRPKVLIWDEPTAVLSDREVEILFRIIKELKQLHVTMIYISHRLEEIFQICDRVAVMRDGQLITVLRNEGLTKEQLIRHMLGHEMDQMYAEKRCEPDDMVVLEADGITTSKVTDVSFKLHKGEILGFAGLVNSGRTETARALYGLDKLKKGSIKLGGKPVHIRRSTDAAKAGLFLAPEDRKREALVLCRSIRENISLSNLGAISRFGFCRRKDERRKVADFCKRLNVKMGSADDAAGTLSGGNQQKVVIAKAIMAEPGILIFDEPTQGIDVGARAEIYALLQDLRSQGMSLIVISSEIEEIQMVCDRAIVFHDGHVTGMVEGEELMDTELILQYMYRRV